MISEWGAAQEMRTAPSQAGTVFSFLQNLHWDPLAHRFHWNGAASTSDGKSPSLTAGAQLFWGTAASITNYSIPSDADTWLKAQPLASNALAQAERAPNDGKQLCADVLFVSYGEEYLFCFPFSKGRWGAWQAELHLTQPKSLPTHLVPHPIHVNDKAFGCMKPPFSKAMSPAAIQASCPEGAHCSSSRPLCSFLAMAPPSVFCWFFNHLQALGPGFLHPSSCLPAASAAWLWFMPRSGRGRSGSLTPPALQTDSSQRQLRANVTATAPAHGRETLT